MNVSRPTTAVLGLLCLLALPHADAAMVRAAQTWEERNFANNGLHASTLAVFSSAGITGLGDERVIVDRFTMTRFLNGIGQNFSVADFNEPHDFQTEGNMFARYVDGVFIGIGNVSTGGAARTRLRTGDLSGGVSGGVNINAGELIWYHPVSGRHVYHRVTTELTTVLPQVPLPGAVWLFASGLLWLARARWRPAPGLR